MKRMRDREEEEEEEEEKGEEEEHVANLLLSLSSKSTIIEETSTANKDAADGGGAFICKTCSRRFASFQALGGHRTSHKRAGVHADESAASKKAKRGNHECSICGLGFSMGQALGGHMRRHRAAPPEDAFLRGQPEVIDLNLAPSDEDGFRGDSNAQLLELFI